MGSVLGNTRRARAGRAIAVVGVAFTMAVLAVTPADAAGLNFPVPMGQRFVGSTSAPKPLPLPLATKIGPIRGLAVTGIQATTFAPIKDPVLGITIFSSSEVKELILDTINGLSDDTELAFKVNSLDHPLKNDFTIGGNCVGADGATTPFCVATVTFHPKTPGAKSDPISAQITITKGMPEVEDSLRDALTNQGLLGSVINLIYPLLRSYVQGSLTDGIESAMLAPVATATGTGVAGPFTDHTVFIKRQYADFAAGTPSSATITSWLKNFENGGAPAAFIDTLRRGDNWHGRIAPVSRLYSAYFLRPPDKSGLTYWVNKSRAGTRLYAISSNFAASSEFQRRYGSLTNRQFVQLIYQNVLGRSPDAAGLSYWTRQLDSGATRGRVMVGFSESSEYVRKQTPNTIVIEIWFGMLKRLPVQSELVNQAARLAGGTSSTTLISEVLGSNDYKLVVLG